MLIILCLALQLKAAFGEHTREIKLSVKVVTFDLPDRPDLYRGVPGVKVHWEAMSPNVPETSDHGQTELPLPADWKPREGKHAIQLDASHPASRKWFISGPADRLVIIPDCAKEECFVPVTVQPFRPGYVVIQERAQANVNTGRKKKKP